MTPMTGNEDIPYSVSSITTITTGCSRQAAAAKSVMILSSSSSTSTSYSKWFWLPPSFVFAGILLYAWTRRVKSLEARAAAAASKRGYHSSTQQNGNTNNNDNAAANEHHCDIEHRKQSSTNSTTTLLYNNNSSLSTIDYYTSLLSASSLFYYYTPAILCDLEIRLYHMLPLRVTSSLWGKINSRDLPVWMRSRIYDFFCRTYNCDMSEALESDYRQYRNLGEFFIRRLKPDSRPISKEPGVVSPADGQILHFGPVRDGRIEQVKGLNYSVQTFLGLPNDNYDDLLANGKEKSDLYHCIIYLAPGDYHRFHSPARWTVKFRRHFPGRLLSVRPSLMKRMPEVLHINERVCYVGQWSHGFFSMTAVGATNVGSIKVNFDEDLRTNRRHLWRPDRYACFEHEFSQEVNLTAGEDFGEFNFGSTIVLIFEAPRNTTFDLEQNQKIKYGQLLSKIPLFVHSEPSNTV